MIGVLKYESCNLSSLLNALGVLSVPYKISNSVSELAKLEKVILPGVGNMKSITKSSIEMLSNDLPKYINDGGKVYGICLGLQMFLEFSEESNTNTLSLIKGKTVKINKIINHKLNVNFNNLIFDNKYKQKEIINKLFKGISEDAKFYFLHSYCCDIYDDDADIINTSIQNKKIPALVIKNSNIIGTQFHPELSKKDGLKFLKNLVDL